MSENTQNNQQTLVIGLAVIAALLAAIVGVIIWQQSTAIPSPTTTGAATPPAGTQSMPPQTAPNGMGGQNLGTGGSGDAAAAPTAFDPKTATKVPKGTEPEAFVKAYYAACEKGDFAKAYEMLPADAKAGQDVAAFTSQMKSYGISATKIASATGDDKEMQIVGVMTAQGMEFPYTWTLVKGTDGTWLVKSRTMGAK